MILRRSLKLLRNRVSLPAHRSQAIVVLAAMAILAHSVEPAREAAVRIVAQIADESHVEQSASNVARSGCGEAVREFRAAACALLALRPGHAHPANQGSQGEAEMKCG